LTGGVKQLRPPETLIEEQGYLAGVGLEYELNSRFTFEVNGLYRPFRARSFSAGVPPGGPARDNGFEFTIVTWQLPVLAKYYVLPNSRVRPIVEAGPSFRFSGNLNGFNPSHYGITFGGGFETRFKRMNLTPVVRYTHWADDPVGVVRSARTASNQTEVLFGFTF
jgi:hypothetical protein